MSKLIINTTKDDEKFITTLLTKLGCEVKVDLPMKSLREKKENDIQAPEDSEISPTYLAGKWKDWQIDPKKYRKQLWQRKI